MDLIVISFRDKQQYHLNVPQGKDMTVLDVKCLLERLYFFPFILQRLVYSSHEIKDNIRIRDLGIKSPSTPIYLILRDESSVTMVRFTIMSVAGARYTVCLPLSATVMHLLEAIASKASCPIKSFSALMKNKRLITPDIQDLPITTVFSIPSDPPETHQIYEEFIVIRHKRQPPSNSVFFRFFQRLIPNKTKSNIKVSN